METTEIWIFSLGSCFAVIGALGLFILNSTNGKIGDIVISVKDLNKDLRDLNQDLREGITGLDRRVTIVEERIGSEYHRREINGHIQ